jgi:hypothetical protein
MPDLNSDLDDALEVLWLAFVMKENYNKVWNGEDWETTVRSVSA